jgi:hypothetical protein
VARVIGPFMCTLWLVFESLGDLGVWLVDIVLPIGHKPLQFLALTLPLGTPCSGQWLNASISLCICPALAKSLRRQLYQAPVSKHFSVSAIVLRFGICISDGAPGGAVSGWPFLQSLLHNKLRSKRIDDH